MINYFIPLYNSILSSGFFASYLLPVLCLCFVATVPCILRYFWRG